MTTVNLVIPGRPVGKQRPRFNRKTGRTYTPQKTVSYEQRVHREWIEAGRPRLEDGPIVAHLWAMYQRPGSHVLKDGSLSALGRRTPFPMPQTDLDNLQKCVFDGLNGLAYHDDRQIVEVHCRRRWGHRDEVMIYLRPAVIS